MLKILHLAHRHVSVSRLQVQLEDGSSDDHTWVFVGTVTAKDQGHWSVKPSDDLPEQIRRQHWDAIVVHGSRQLVIPTLYCRLKQRQLLHLLPEDLDLYLHDITSQNRKRNKAILEEVMMLSTLFKRHHIEHVFLKGTALLASGYYEDIAERMIGDIDILVATKQLDKAFELLQQHSFKPLPQNFGSHYFEHKHLPRMTTNKFLKLFFITTK